MQTTTIGNNLITACRCCDVVLSVKFTDDPKLGDLSALVDQHLADNPKCQAFQDNLPSLIDCRGISLNATDGLPAEEFVRKMRDEEWDLLLASDLFTFPDRRPV